MRRRICWSDILLAGFIVLGFATAGRSEDLEQWIQERMVQSRIPGLAAGIVRDGSVVWTRAWGLRDVEAGLPAHTATPFGQASVSKVVTATALLHLMDQGHFSLDESIDGWLPFVARNPMHASRPITFRQLLTHSSSIVDNWDVLDSLVTHDDSPIALGAFLGGYLLPGGSWYDRRENFSQARPGQRIEYSNVGIALVGYLVERISGIPFYEYCDQQVFATLGMTDSAWLLDDLPVHEVARPYEWRADA